MARRRYWPEQFLYYDGEGIARHLEKMAARGWRLEKIGALSWRYGRAEPAKVHCAVTYFPEASEYNPYPTDSQEEFYDYCREAGWELVTEWDQMQIFSTERVHPVPIETDEAARVRVIHRAMLRRFLPANLLLFALLVIQLGIFITGVLQNPAANLSKPSVLLITLALALMGLSVFLTLTGYLAWYLRARKAAETGKRLAGTEQRFRTLTVAVAALGVLSVVFAALSTAGSRGGPWYALLVTGEAAAFVALVAVVIAYMSRRGVERKQNRNITLAVAAALSLLMINVIPGAVIGPRAAELHIVDRTVLPLALEDLGIPEEGLVSTWESRSSPLVAFRAGEQSGPYDSGLPWLRYEVSDVKLPMLFDLCLDGYLDRYDNEYGRLTGGRFRPLNDPAWDAEVWQVWDDEGPWPYYLACKDGRIVWLMTDDFLTPEQTKTASEKLFGRTI